MEVELVTIHLVALCITAVFIVIADHDGLQYARGIKQTLDARRVKFLHYAVITGLCTMVVTGTLMFGDMWGELIKSTAFYIKIFMVCALFANSVVIGSLMHQSSLVPFCELNDKDKRKIFATGGVSVFCWVGATIIGLFFL